MASVAAAVTAQPAAALRTTPQIQRPVQTVLRALGILPASPAAPSGNPIRDFVWGLFRRTESSPQTTTTLLAAQTAAATTGNNVNYSVSSDWGSGHTAALTLTAGSTSLNGWTVEFDTPAKIVNIWNGKITSHVGDHYVISNMSYNGKVAAGQSTSFGYQATPGAVGSAPTNIKVNGVAIGTATPPTAPTMSISDVSVTEGNSGTTNANFAVSLSNAATTPVTVAYATANGTATAGSDYTATSGTLTFAPGVTTQTVAVKVTGDTTVESDETFTVA
ncbi:MAG: cellulose binding domain-containing protein, partial [Mycobacterium sp.]|nr:cellulose binding domain-containing protein [Mycobacterium sp.]